MRINPSLLPVRKSLSLLLVAFGLAAGPDARGESWELEAGQKIRGEAVSFDYSEKTLEVRDAVTGKVRHVPAVDLSRRSQQRLLLSREFHRSFPGENGWPDEKHYLLRLAVLFPAPALFAGFWLGAGYLTRQANPLRALLGFVGGWIVGALFVAFYFFFAGRFGGGLPTILVGVALGTIFLSFFVSLVYSCSATKGFLIFAFQIVAALLLCLVGLGLSEITVPPETLESLWDDRVFKPSGLLPRG